MRNFFLKNKKGPARIATRSVAGGYTIIETMIAISLFLVVITSGMTALLNANVLHQKSQNLRSEMDNLSFVMEDMSRNIRIGSTYHCAVGNDTITFDGTTPKSSPNGATCWGVVFEPSGGNPLSADQWAYEVVSSDGGLTYHISKSVDGGSTWTQMTPDEIHVNSSSGFIVLGAEPPSMQNIQGNSIDQQQPFVSMRLIGTITLQGVVTPFSLETSVSQRQVDI